MKFQLCGVHWIALLKIYNSAQTRLFYLVSFKSYAFHNSCKSRLKYAKNDFSGARYRWFYPTTITFLIILNRKEAFFSWDLSILSELLPVAWNRSFGCSVVQLGWYENTLCGTFSLPFSRILQTYLCDITIRQDFLISFDYQYRSAAYQLSSMKV